MNMKPTLTILTALLLAAAAHADLVAHLRFDGDLKDAAGRHDGARSTRSSRLTSRWDASEAPW
jgi:hypothetical protein